jgi:hypothetical protein
MKIKQRNHLLLSHYLLMPEYRICSQDFSGQESEYQYAVSHHQICFEHLQ